MTIARRYRNLVGVPSCHTDPIFAREVRRVTSRSRPTIVALELPVELQPEMEWAVSCWPAPVASLSRHQMMPFIPGDSMVEAYRLAQTAGIPVRFIDINATSATRPNSIQFPRPEMARRLGPLFGETIDALVQAAAPPDPADDAREAFMARELAGLMKTEDRVLWVGGAAHWASIVNRIRKGDFSAPIVPLQRKSRFRRVRLSASALHMSVAQLPWMVARYAACPDRFESTRATHSLCLKALRLSSRACVRTGNRSMDPNQIMPETGTPADIARMLIYARNLATTTGLGDRPTLGNLLTAASAVIGNQYAGWLLNLAMQESCSDETANLPVLTFETRRKRSGFRLGNRWVAFDNYQEENNVHFWSSAENEVLNYTLEPYESLPAGNGSTKVWQAYPVDVQNYDLFVQHVLDRASALANAQTNSRSFSSGLMDGIDVRSTIRHWQEGSIYVHENARSPLKITNGLIDYTSHSEDAAVLRGEPHSGWVDPDSFRIGSCSREVRCDTIQNYPCTVTMRHRELSLITLDLPTCTSSAEGGNFFDRVINPLVSLPIEEDNLYRWLDIMFAFCKGKPFAYFSRYRPSCRIKAIARKHGVHVIHFPLSTLPGPLLKHHHTFRYLYLTRNQWDRILDRIEESSGPWGAVGGSARSARSLDSSGGRSSAPRYPANIATDSRRHSGQ